MIKSNLSEKILIIPDIHNDYHTAEKIIKKENPDKIIFLGDYFDDFYYTVKDAANVAKWLIKSLQQKNRIHLIGNHDLSYMTQTIPASNVLDIVKRNMMKSKNMVSIGVCSRCITG